MTNESNTSYIDHEMVDEHGDTIGTVTDVLYDDHDDTGEPKWLVVKPGLMKAERYVPVERSYETDDGHIVVPFDKKWIKEAPKAGDHILTEEVEEAAAEHYDLTP